MNQKPMIILGAGGHTKVLIDALLRQSANLLGITDPNPGKIGESILGVPVIGDDDKIRAYSPDSIELVNGIGIINSEKRRQQIFENFKRQGYKFASVIHDSAVLLSEVELSEGVQIMAGAVIQPGSKIGTNSIINSKACIDHDSIIGDHVHVAPGVTISGGVQIGDGTLIGAGATIIQGIIIGAYSIVAAGAVVIRDVLDGMTVMGIPAKVVK
jgi:sugar O-acyltransferase (sialic acid O-acetyltransferase NeuD family)